MPVSQYYKGRGKEVMESMQERYGEEGGKRVFYATANKRKMNRPGKKKHKKVGGKSKRGRKKRSRKRGHKR